MGGDIRYRKIFDPNHKRSLVEEARVAIERGDVEDISAKIHSDNSEQHW